MKRIFLLVTVCVLSVCGYAQTIENRIRHVVDSMYREKPRSVGIMIHVESPGRHISWSYAVGYADSNKTKITPDQPALVASNTKTYVSAAILKLIELKKIYLAQPIDSFISAKSRKQLIDKGYNVQDITIRHLLSHTSGIDDYANDDYFAFVNTHRKHKWTRDEQIELAMKVGKPRPPGDSFKYADVNYLLLTEIIEKCTHKPFYQAIADLDNFKELKIKSTWFVNLQQKPAKTGPLVHQHWNKYPWDSYDLDPSWDLYGGGGIALTTGDLALFFQGLFECRIIKDSALLNQMVTNVPSGSKTNYCLGIRKLTMDGRVGYYHGGFWGTDAIYFPDLNASIVIFILERSERDISADLCKDVAKLLDGKR